MLKPAEVQPPLSVTELALEIKRELRPLWRVFVKGEVSGMKQLGSGHYSFRINDAQSRLDAFLFANDARRLPLIPEDGQEFVFRGRVDFAPKYGQLRLIVDYVEYDDVGRLRAQLEQLKQRLEAEGAFDARRKRPLPFLPRRVALITSPTGAVIHDLQETIWDRFPNMEILVYPAQVQGTASPGSVAAALRRCNAEALASVVVIARGGGSFEELYAFNTEPVARAILASRIPVVTALGHTSDRTVADLVGDAECRTPTEAGARVVPRKADLLASLAERRRRLQREADRGLQRELERLARRQERLAQAIPNLLRARAERLRRCRAQLELLSPRQQLARRNDALLERRGRLHRAALLRVAQARTEIEQRRRQLVALSPDSVLQRGYSITQDDETGAVLRAASATAPRRRVRIRLAAGSLTAGVEEVHG